MKCFGITDKGRIREDNQDCFIIEKKVFFFVNCIIFSLREWLEEYYIIEILEIRFY